MRGRLIFPLVAELFRLHTSAMAEGEERSLYDRDFKEPVLLDQNDDGVREVSRLEMPPLKIPCQVEPKRFEDVEMTATGNSPRSELELVFHFKDLERLGLVHEETKAPLIGSSDRLGALYDKRKKLVQTFRNPPGLFVQEARPIGFGLSESPQRNLLLVTFESRGLSRRGLR